MEIKVDDSHVLTEYQPEDQETLTTLLSDSDIQAATLRLPAPFTPEDAARWLQTVAETTKRTGRPTQFALRGKDKKLIGGCAFDSVNIEKPGRSEIGYWIGKQHWGKGLMAAAVKAACDYAFKEFKLSKITAHVFARNMASVRVLEQCGFELEGTLRNHILKDGETHDAYLYGLLKPDVPVDDEHILGH